MSEDTYLHIQSWWAQQQQQQQLAPRPGFSPEEYAAMLANRSIEYRDQEGYATPSYASSYGDDLSPFDGASSNGDPFFHKFVLLSFSFHPPFPKHPLLVSFVARTLRTTSSTLNFSILSRHSLVNRLYQTSPPSLRMNITHGHSTHPHLTSLRTSTHPSLSERRPWRPTRRSVQKSHPLFP